MDIQFTKTHRFLGSSRQPYRLQDTVSGTSFDQAGALALRRRDEWVPATKSDCDKLKESALRDIGFWTDKDGDHQATADEVRTLDKMVGSTSYNENGDYTTITTNLQKVPMNNSYGLEFVEHLAVLRSGQ